MIDSKEIREGNKVIANGLYEGKIKTVSRWVHSPNIIFFKESIAGEYNHDCEPIPLTEYILIDCCGFEKTEPSGWYKLKDKMLHFQDMLLFKPIDGSPIHYADGCFSPDLNYVHELQNLFYALCKKELPIQNI